jgi:hypothetical protein
MVAAERRDAENTVSALPALRFEILEASRILRMSRARYITGSARAPSESKKTARGLTLPSANSNVT